MSLDQKTREADRIYEEFEPPSDWDQDGESHTVILMLPGFKKEQLRVQVTSFRVIRVSGERQISQNKWRRFCKEFPMPSDSDTNDISAKFEAGILYVRLPKVIIKQQPTTQEAPKPQQPITTPPQKPNNAQVSDQKKPIMEEKAAAESKLSEGQKPAVKERMAEKGKELKDHVNSKVGKKEERVEGDNAMASKDEERHGTSEGKMEKKKSLTMDTVSLQGREYMNALCGLVDEVKKKKKLVNLLVLVFFVLLFGLYVKNAVKSYF